MMRAHCGMLLDEYLQLNFAQYLALKKEIFDTVKREDFRAGLLECRIRQLGGDKKAHALDAFPYWKENTDTVKDKKDVQGNIRTLFGKLKAVAKPKQNG